MYRKKSYQYTIGWQKKEFFFHFPHDKKIMKIQRFKSLRKDNYMSENISN